MEQFLWGAIMMGYMTVAVFFLRFWRKTRDRLFSLFSISFFILAAERFILSWTRDYSDTNPFVYLCRLVAFGLIVLAIIDRNRAAER